MPLVCTIGAYDCAAYSPDRIQRIHHVRLCTYQCYAGGGGGGARVGDFTWQPIPRVKNLTSHIIPGVRLLDIYIARGSGIWLAYIPCDTVNQQMIEEHFRVWGTYEVIKWLRLYFNNTLAYSKLLKLMQFPFFSSPTVSELVIYTI